MPDPFDNQSSNNNNNDDRQQPRPIGNDGQFAQHIRHQQVSARIPESVSRGVFSTGALVLQGNHEFVLDFIVAVTRPHQVAARVIMPPTIMPSMLRAMKQNLDNYSQRFGDIPELPKPQQQQNPPSVEEIYDQLKLPDEELSGVYANTVMITHSPSEFVFDFITNFYPRSAVSARIFLTAPQVPRFYETLSRSFDQYQQKMAERQRQIQQQQGNQFQQPGDAQSPQPGNTNHPDFHVPPGTLDPDTPTNDADQSDDHEQGGGDEPDDRNNPPQS